MDSSDKFWVCIWTIVAICFLGLLVAIDYNTSINNKAIAHLISTGVNPIMAFCSIHGGGDSNQAMCALATKGL